MARRKKQPDKGPSNAYLMSFGDTMTTLLAFFIVLSSLAEEQTGVNLYQGTGSFVRTLASFGMPGNLPGRRHRTAVPRETNGPLYVVPDADQGDTDRQAAGPDETDNATRVVDREREDFERFVNELERFSQVKEHKVVQGEAVFDVFNKLNAQAPLLGEEYRKAVGQFLPMLYKENHRVEIVVWTTTPSPTAWQRAARTATQLRAELAEMGRLDADQRARLTTTAKPWIDREAKRPVVSFIVRKVG